MALTLSLYFPSSFSSDKPGFADLRAGSPIPAGGTALRLPIVLEWQHDRVAQNYDRDRSYATGFLLLSRFKVSFWRWRRLFFISLFSLMSNERHRVGSREDNRADFGR